MRITDGKSDAIKLIRRIKKEMFNLQHDLMELEYLIYECDDRVEINIFERGSYDKKGRKK